MKKARIVRAARYPKNGEIWELRAGIKGKGKILHEVVGVLVNQPRSVEFAFNCLINEADRQGYEVVWDY